MTSLPLDVNNNPIPALRLKTSGGAHAITVSGTSARNSTAFAAGTRVISLYATTDIYVRLGGASVAATSADHFFPANTYYDIALGGGETGHATHIAALQVSGGGTLYVSEKE
ncbi:MAG: hypothetical protein LRZ85_02200 [Alphaproteobacteria bacterium]|nr:hypothetical protein [Alphaproteobacteria bacterium]MCD8526495.1 hypothetical protein [Alphaproteobacteria bacterium]MCD8570366.1 hypothetical protein [Alphaproteobacteria bacterium]